MSSKEVLNVIQVAEMIWSKVYGDTLNLSFNHDEPYIYDVQKRIPETIKAENLLGFRADTRFENALDELIPWIKSSIKKGLI